VAQLAVVGAVLAGFTQGAMAACPGGGTPAQEELGRLLLNTNYKSISCKYLGTPYTFEGLQAHAGIDYPAAGGTTVYAPMSGKLFKSSTFIYGNAVYYDLGNGKKLFIHHLKDYKTGDVKKGDPIAKVYQDHVHAELRVGYNGDYLLGGASCGTTCTASQVEQKTDDPASALPPTVSSISVSCNNTLINESTKNASICGVTALLSDGTTKKITGDPMVSWIPNPTSVITIDKGLVSSNSVSKDTPVRLVVAYERKGATVTITVKDVPVITPPIKYRLSVSNSSYGKVTSSPTGINCGSGSTACAYDYAANSTVTLTATPNSGDQLSGWQGCDSNPSFNTCTVKMTANKSVMPYFTQTQVTSVSPLTATYGTKTTFTVKGTNLPSTLAFWIGECANLSPVSGGTATSRSFTCTPSYSKGVKDGVVKDKSGGKELYPFKVTVK